MAQTAPFALDVNGNGTHVFAWDFKYILPQGSSLQTSPPPAIQIVPNSAQPVLTITDVQISGTQVQAQVTVTGAQEGMVYESVGVGYFSSTLWDFVYGDIVMIGPN